MSRSFGYVDGVQVFSTFGAGPPFLYGSLRLRTGLLGRVLGSIFTLVAEPGPSLVWVSSITSVNGVIQCPGEGTLNSWGRDHCSTVLQPWEPKQKDSRQAA